MGKWDEGFSLAPLGSVEPTTVAALLRDLQLTAAPEPKQRAGISRWLQDHKPSPMMEHSLRRKGYAVLLDKRASA